MSKTPTAAGLDRYYTVRQVADTYQVSDEYVRNAIRRGDLRAVRVGDGWRIAESDIQVWAAAREPSPSAK